MKLEVERLSKEEVKEGVAVNTGHIENLRTNENIRISKGRNSIITRISFIDEVGPEEIKMSDKKMEELNVSESDTVNLRVHEDVVHVKVETEMEDKISENKKERIAKDSLRGKLVTEGEILNPEDWAGNVSVEVTKIEYKDEVRVNDSTDIKVSGDPIRESSKVTYSDVGGLREEIREMRDMVELPLKFPEVYEKNGISKPSGVLLYGPPGTGKTYLSMAVANETDVNFEYVAAPEIISKYRGESSDRLREVFDEACDESPSIVFIDEIDAIAGERKERGREGQASLVAQLLSLMDGLDEKEDVIVIGATNRVDTIDSAIRRTGRFDREIKIGIPDKEEREEILEVQMRELNLSEEVDIETISEKTHGYVASDLQSLSLSAGMSSIRRQKDMINLDSGDVLDEDIYDIEIKMKDVRQAINETSPSTMRDFDVNMSDVDFDDVGGLDEQKKEVKKSVLWPLEEPGVYEDSNTEPPKGVLLYGPPGTGKTLLAKAVANEADANFINVNGPEIFNKFVGESEKKIREIFERARQNSPCIVFLDEIDAIASERGSGATTSGASDNVVSQLLTEIQGVDELEDVFIMGATNIKESIDPAILRPGRIEKHISFSNPSPKELKEIYNIHTRNKPLGENVNIENLVSKTIGMNGSEVEAICRTASMNAIERTIEKDSSEVVITLEDFRSSIKEIEEQSSVKQKDEIELKEM